MLNWILKGILSAVAAQLLDNYRYLSIRLLKIEAAKSYLRGLRLARLSVIGLMRMGLVIGLICIGALLFHVSLFILLPWTVKAKAVLGLFMGAAYVVIGCVALRAAMSERTWMEKSGTAKMLEEITGQSKK